MNSDNKIAEAITAVAALAEVVPVYQDALQPAAQELGKSLELIAKTINVALAPLKGLVWSYNQIEIYLTSALSEKLVSVPPERLTTPRPEVAGPAIEALRFVAHEPTLRELYANLLATAIDSKTAADAHPAFVESIKQMTPDEAKILTLFSSSRPFPILHIRAETKNDQGGVDVQRNFSLLGTEARVQYPDLTPSYLDNLARLGLVEIFSMSAYTDKTVYDPLIADDFVHQLKIAIESQDRSFKIVRGRVQLTTLGKQFIKACVTARTHE